MGNAHYNGEWYNKVVEACALAQDFGDLAKGDATGVGSGGSALSGGQRARVVSILLASSWDAKLLLTLCYRLSRVQSTVNRTSSFLMTSSVA